MVIFAWPSIYRLKALRLVHIAVRHIKKQNQLYCKRHKRFKRTTNSDHNRSVYKNLLEQQFVMNHPNQAWVSDITYIWTAEGWLYLAALKDLYTEQIVGYSLKWTNDYTTCLQHTQHGYSQSKTVTRLNCSLRQRQPILDLLRKCHFQWF